MPLVATKADGAKHYVQHENNGLLVDIDDCEALVAALDCALNDKPMRKQLIKGGTKTYKELFSRDSVIKELIKSYKNMIKQYAKG